MTTYPLSWRVQHTSNTPGTGTLTLNAAAANRRSLFDASGGVAQSVGMVFSVPGTNQFEVGVVTYNGGNPGTLARGTPLFSSNGGARVSFSGVIDCFPFDFPGQRRRAPFTTTATATQDQLGCVIAMTGGANGTLNLPSISSVPLGAGYLVMNRGSAGAWLTIDPSGSETINGGGTLTIFGGESVEIFATATGWEATGLPALSLVRRQVASASANLDFLLPPGFSEFELRFSDVAPATDGAVLALRTSVDSGGSFAAGASDYFFGFLIDAAASNGTASAMQLTYSMDTVSAAIATQGVANITIGSPSRRPTVSARTGGGVSNVSVQYGLFSSSCARNATAAINAVRLLMDVGNISTGTFSLYAVR